MAIGSSLCRAQEERDRVVAKTPSRGWWANGGQVVGGGVADVVRAHRRRHVDRLGAEADEEDLRWGDGAGIQHRYWGSGPRRCRAGIVEAEARVSSRSGQPSVRIGALTPLAGGGRHDTGEVGTASSDVGPHAGCYRDGAHDARPPLGRPGDPRSRRLPVRRWVEGWYGQPYPKPLARRGSTSRSCGRSWRQKPVQVSGQQVPDAPRRRHRPRQATEEHHPPGPSGDPDLLGAEGPKNVALAAEICDGWLPLFFSPKDDAHYRRCLADGFAASGEPDKAARFAVAATLFIVPGDDVERCADMIRPVLALYAGGMGARGTNFNRGVRPWLRGRGARIQRLTWRQEGRGHRLGAVAMSRSVAWWPLRQDRDELPAGRRMPPTMNVGAARGLPSTRVIRADAAPTVRQPPAQRRGTGPQRRAGGPHLLQAATLEP